MKIISIDLEMNQPSGSIIMLGYVIADPKLGEVIHHNRIFVNPKEPINPSISDLTGISEEHLQNQGTSLAAAYKQLCSDILKYQVHRHPLQWGLDHEELRKQLQIPWDEYIFRRRAHDVKSLYQLHAMNKPDSKVICGLEVATNLIRGWSYRFGAPHDALADAYNTFLLFKRLTDKMRMYDEIEKKIIR